MIQTMNKNKHMKIPTLKIAFENYIKDRRDLRPTTVLSYREVIKRAGDLLDVPIDEIKYSDIKHLYSNLRYEQNYKPASIELLNNLINPVFNMAVRDEIISKNPVHGVFKDVARGVEWKTHKRAAVSYEDQKEFLAYVKSHSSFKRWENLFIFLFGTGLRIGETVALCWEDVDFKEKTIDINKSYYYHNGIYYAGPPKSEAGYRKIPMLKEVEEALRREQEIAKLTQAPVGDMVPGETGLVFLSSKGTMLFASTVNNAIKNIVESYNKNNPDKEPLKKFSVHQMRHSFCSRLCEQDVNIKVVQTVMGHSDFETTMNIYAEISNAKTKLVFDNLDGKIV